MTLAVPGEICGVKVRKIIQSVVLLALAVAVLAGCDKNEPSESSSKPGQVIVTPAYQRYFGAAPSVDKGTAYAFVIYFPSSKDPGKIVPFPFFTFDQQSMQKVAIERLLSGMDVGSYRGEFISVPAGSRLIAITDDKGTVTANFSKELESAAAPVATAVALTLRQFTGAKAVRLQVEGKETALTTVAKNAADTAVQQPSPPRLLSVTAMRDKGASDVDDVNAFFDRPVDVKELTLLSVDGKTLQGEIYHSVFDMAAVLKPKDPSQFKVGLPIKVRWKVVDKLGRPAEGDSVWPLEIKEH
jgi:germination protein M